MRIVHMADLHLGYRQYQRSTPSGINQREHDVAATFRRAIDKVIELEPEFVLIAGDVFHTVRPSNPAILHAFLQFARLVEALPSARVVMIAGNHDTPRATETGCILRLFSPLGIHVVEGAPSRLEFPDVGVSILAVPDVTIRPPLTPDPTARYNVLLIHGEVAGVLPEHARRIERATPEITQDELAAARWDYVALGHYHVHREVAPNAFYSGSLDYTSTNPWGEITEEQAAGAYHPERGGKGIVEWDLTMATHVFHPLEVARPLVDVERIDGSGMAAAEIDAAIQNSLARSRVRVDDNIARVVITNVPRHVGRQLDQKAVRELKRRALHFHLDVRRPEVARSSVGGAPGRRASLADMLREKLDMRPIAPEVDRVAFVALGLDYLRKADASSVAVGAADSP